MLPPAMVFPIATTTVDRTIHVGACCLRGWSFQETTAAAGAALVIFDGPAAAAQIVAAITLATNESTRDYPPGEGILLRTSAFLNVVSGSIKGALWLTPISHAADLEFAFGERGPYWVNPGV